MKAMLFFTVAVIALLIIKLPDIHWMEWANGAACGALFCAWMVWGIRKLEERKQ